MPYGMSKEGVVIPIQPSWIRSPYFWKEKYQLQTWIYGNVSLGCQKNHTGHVCHDDISFRCDRFPHLMKGENIMSLVKFGMGLCGTLNNVSHGFIDT